MRRKDVVGGLGRCKSEAGIAALRHHAAPLTTAWRKRQPSFLVALLVLCAACRATAVRINMTNCLPDWHQSSSPPYLQWQPVYADASFDTAKDSHKLRLTVWGNVAGSIERTELPPPTDSHWQNPKETKGKIVETADPDSDDQRATTLYQRIRVLTYEPWHNITSFCKDGLVNGTCPLGPVFGAQNTSNPQGRLPSLTLSHDLYSSYGLASFSATMLIIYGDHKGTNIGCMSATITPDLGGLSQMLRFLPLLILGFTGLTVTIAGALSPWGTTNMLHWSTNYGRDVDLLRLVTPGFGDCLQYIQFVVLTGGLSLSYPGFYQPVVSQAAWSSLMFNQSLVTGDGGRQSVVDGIYVTNGTSGYGLEQLGQLIGMSHSADMWPGMMVWLCGIVGGVVVAAQGGFLVQWAWRRVRGIAEEDLRAKRIPFSVGNVVRVVFNYMLVPIVALSTFQLVVARQSPAYAVGLAVVGLVLLGGVAMWILLAIVRTRPKSVLFDDLPTALRYGPLYNTFADEAAGFALIPVVVNVMRGIAIGAVQASGVAQVVLLAICEVIQLFTLHAFRPYEAPTSMNAYHTLFALLRGTSILLMVAFVPSLGVTEGPKGWIGYAILLMHGLVLLLGFLLTALQTMIEVVARMLGAGSDDRAGLTRGGLGKIFGMRQLSRRVTHREGPSRASQGPSRASQGPSRASQVSTQGMLDANSSSSNGYMMATARVRSSSTASLRLMAVHHRHRSSSALDSIDRGGPAGTSASSCLEGTPRETTTFSFLEPPNHARHGMPVGLEEASDPYYRPPRRRRDTWIEVPPLEKTAPATRGPATIRHAAATPRHAAGLALALGRRRGTGVDATDSGDDETRGVPSAAPLASGGSNNNLANMHIPANRPDYMTREVDYYYGVRGPALNSEGPGRKLGTGPADPTGPVATATAWLRNLFTAKMREKSKGFEVVRSSRMPPAMVRSGGFGDETPPEGIPVAMGVLRNGPIESDDDDDDDDHHGHGGGVSRAKRAASKGPDNLLTAAGDAQVSDADETEADLAGRPSPLHSDASFHHGSLIDAASPSHDDDDDDDDDATVSTPLPQPVVAEPAATQHLQQQHLDLPLHTSALPFERTPSQDHLSSKSSLDFPGDLVDVSLHPTAGDRPASYGVVPHLEINRVDPELPMDDLLGSSAELVDDRCAGSTS